MLHGLLNSLNLLVKNCPVGQSWHMVVKGMQPLNSDWTMGYYKVLANGLNFSM